MKNGVVLPLGSTLGGGINSNRPGPVEDGFERMREAFPALAAAGVRQVRIPFDWSRLESSSGRWDRDCEDRYDKAIAAAHEAGLQVWACLFEWIVPAWFDNDGNFADDKATRRFWPRYVGHVAERFGDSVNGWVPFDRPTQFARGAFLNGGWPPRRSDPRLHGQVVITMIEAWRDAWRILRGVHPVMTMLGLEKVDATTLDDAESARMLDAHVWRVWPNALRDGVISVPGWGDRNLADLAGSCDVVGAAVSIPSTAEASDLVAEYSMRLAEVIPDRPLCLVIPLGPRREVEERCRFIGASLLDVLGGGLPLGGLWPHRVGNQRSARPAWLDLTYHTRKPPKRGRPCSIASTAQLFPPPDRQAFHAVAQDPGLVGSPHRMQFASRRSQESRSVRRGSQGRKSIERPEGRSRDGQGGDPN